MDDISSMMGLSPDAIKKKLLTGDFGQALVAFVNKHQKGNRLMMETLTGKPYPLKAVTTQQLMDSTKGKQGAAGLTFILELMQNQQRDLIHALAAAIKTGQEKLVNAGAQLQAAAAPTPQAAPTDGAGSTPAGEGGAGPGDEASAESDSNIEVVTEGLRERPPRDEAAAHAEAERRRLEDLAQERER